MAIVDYDYYANQYYGEAIAECQFPQYLAKATRAIILITHGRAADYAVLPAFQQAAIRDAICAQIEYYLSNGLLSVTTGTSSEGFTVGKVSVTAGNSSTNAFATRGAAMLSPAAQMYLEQTGLLGRAVAVPVEPFAPFPWEII